MTTRSRSCASRPRWSAASASGWSGVRGRRDGAAVEAALVALRSAAATDENVMPHLVSCARAYASEGEICDALREVWGVYRETPVF